MNDLSRAVALKALAADVASRLKLGEKPDAIRAELLAEGYPPEVVDHVFAACESARPATGRRRTVIAATVSGLLFLTLPLAGAFGGAWAAMSLRGANVPTDQVPADLPPELDARDAERVPELDERIKAEARGAGGGGALLAILLGGAVGFALGLGAAFAATNILSAWSIDGSLADDAIDE